MFDEFRRDSELPRWTIGDHLIASPIDLSEDGGEIQVMAELPALFVCGRPDRAHAPGQRIATKRI